MYLFVHALCNTTFTKKKKALIKWQNFCMFLVLMSEINFHWEDINQQKNKGSDNFHWNWESLFKEIGFLVLKTRLPALNTVTALMPVFHWTTFPKICRKLL